MDSYNWGFVEDIPFDFAEIVLMGVKGDRERVWSKVIRTRPSIEKATNKSQKQEREQKEILGWPYPMPSVDDRIKRIAIGTIYKKVYSRTTIKY